MNIKNTTILSLSMVLAGSILLPHGVTSTAYAATSSSAATFESVQSIKDVSIKNCNQMYGLTQLLE
ncbi:hypothetical protein IFO66_23265 [Paenibacillus sp. CAU 1523]|uniref:Uncharacterized protein n=1 Tax=Paenibacillus arenosi TaxID=2774142 RepID=A0ABR9B487_9BACL|nr:hypothetical protein [Paenibacillus arenosi]MBD8501198.1 hypothetical protein [Paenibacillus arenosi]